MGYPRIHDIGAKNNVRLHCSKWPRPLLECQSLRSWDAKSSRSPLVLWWFPPQKIWKNMVSWWNFEAAVELPSKISIHDFIMLSIYHHLYGYDSYDWSWPFPFHIFFSIYIATKSRYPDISSHGCRNPRLFLVHASHLLDLRFLHHLSDIFLGPPGEAPAGRKRSIRRSNPSPGMASWSLAWKVWKSREKSGKVGKSRESREKSGKVWKKSGKVWKSLENWRLSGLKLAYLQPCPADSTHPQSHRFWICWINTDPSLMVGSSAMRLNSSWQIWASQITHNLHGPKWFGNWLGPVEGFDGSGSGKS